MQSNLLNQNLIIVSNGVHILSHYKKGASVSSLALCALIPLSFITAYGHTTAESTAANDSVRSDLEENIPEIKIPTLNPVSPASSELQPANLGSTAHLVDEHFTVGKNTYHLSLTQTRETGHASVYLNAQEVMKFRSDVQDFTGKWQTPTDRAQTAAVALKSFLQSGGLMAEIEPASTEGKTYLVAQGNVLAEVDPVTARQARLSVQKLAVHWSQLLKRAITSPIEAGRSARAVATNLIGPTVLKVAQPYQANGKLVTLKARQIGSGFASWYGPGFHGHRAANGSFYNQYAMTAAHKSLPFGSLVKVTNRLNGKQCVVKITDRGPYVGSRVIDLSRKAAESIGMLGSGVAKVSLELIASAQ